jgi:heme exporter protein D
VIWGSVAEFADMGGYALYVWGSVLMTAATVAWECAALLQRRRRAIVLVHEQALLDREQAASKR